MVLSRLKSATSPLQLAVLLFQLPQPPQFRRTQPTILLLPVIERGIADTQLPADFFNRRAKLGLLQGKRNLLLGKFASLYVMTPFVKVEIMLEILLLNGTV
jgi:hypothetical protein